MLGNVDKREIRWLALALFLVLILPTSASASPLLLVIADAPSVVSDGLSSTTLTLWATDEVGAFIADGSLLPLESTLGQVLNITPTSGGMATATFRAGTWPGVAGFYAEGFQLFGDLDLPLSPGEPLSTALHLHGSFSERNGTMLGHSIEAEALGVDVMFWTDHDVFYYQGSAMESAGYNFDNGGLMGAVPFWPPGSVLQGEWLLTSETMSSYTSSVIPAARHAGARGWRLKGTGAGGVDWKELQYEYTVRPALTTKNLMAQVDFAFWLRPGIRPSSNAELWITVPLSAGLDGEDNAIYFYHSANSYAALETEHQHYVRINADRGVWTEVRADITAMAEEFFPDVGSDQRAEFVKVLIRAKGAGLAYYDLDDFTWTQEIKGETLRDEQRTYVEGLPFAPLQLVGVEITPMPDAHLNAFGTQVPLVPYDQPGLAPETLSDAVEFVHSYGGLVSYNHMFGTKEYAFDDQTRADLVVDAISTLTATGVYGCDMLEVGYRSRGGVLADFMEVWDALSQAGVIITGEGASDQHFQTNWGADDNNFVTWVPAASETEEDLLWNLKRGAVYFGDPTHFEGGAVEVRFGDPIAQADQGQVVIGAVSLRDVTFQISSVQEGWKIRLVENGSPTEEIISQEAGPFAASFPVVPLGGNVVRMEVLSAEDDPVLFTNPIYYLDTDPGNIPPERLPSP